MTTQITTFLSLFISINIIPGLIFSSILTKKTNRTSIYDKLILAIILAPLPLVAFSSLENYLRIPQTTLVLATNLTLILFLTALYFRNLKIREIKFIPDNKKGFLNILPYFLFTGVLLARLLPVANILTPILHDPISHGIWLRLLNTTHFATTAEWYPQGFEFFLNYYVSFSSISYARAILLATNYFNALFPISIFYFGMLIQAKRKDPVILLPFALFFFATMSAIPTDLFFTAGKNSMIFTFSLVPLFLALMEKLKTKTEYTLASIFAFAVFIIHIPTGIFLYILFSTTVVAKLIKNEFTSIKDFFLKIALPVVLTLIFLGVVLHSILPIYKNAPASDDNSIQAISSSLQATGVSNFFASNLYNFQISTFGLLIVIVSLFGLSVIFYELFRKKKTHTNLLISLFALVILDLLVLGLKDKSLGVFFNTEFLFFSIFFSIFLCGIFASYFSENLTSFIKNNTRKNIFFYSLICLITFSSSVFIYKQYQSYVANLKILNTTTRDDIKAFNFINKHLQNDNKKILIQMIKSNGIIMGTDSGVWLSSFTNKKVEVNFVNFSSQYAYKIYELYDNIIQNKNAAESINQLYCKFDIGYIFYGSHPVFANVLPKETLTAFANNEISEIYSSKNTTILKIKPASCN